MKTFKYLLLSSFAAQLFAINLNSIKTENHSYLVECTKEKYCQNSVLKNKLKQAIAETHETAHLQDKVKKVSVSFKIGTKKNDILLGVGKESLKATISLTTQSIENEPQELRAYLKMGFARIVQNLNDHLKVVELEKQIFEESSIKFDWAYSIKSAAKINNQDRKIVANKFIELLSDAPEELKGKTIKVFTGHDAKSFRLFHEDSLFFPSLGQSITEYIIQGFFLQFNRPEFFNKNIKCQNIHYSTCFTLTADIAPEFLQDTPIKEITWTNSSRNVNVSCAKRDRFDCVEYSIIASEQTFLDELKNAYDEKLHDENSWKKYLFSIF